MIDPISNIVKIENKNPIPNFLNGLRLNIIKDIELKIKPIVKNTNDE